MNRIPHGGTRLRKFYDLFQANKGIPIKVTVPGGGRLTSDLRDYHGLDIRSLKRNTWLLAGEWFGKVYVDYVAERIERSEASQ